MPLKDSHPAASRSLLAVLVMASATVITLDYRGGAESPLQPAREAVGSALAPAERGAAVLARPLTQVGDYLSASSALRTDIARLQAENSTLRGQVATTSDVRHRAAELDALLQSSQRHRLALVPARVMGIGAAQSFSRTVTIDAGTSSGVHPDQTVVNYDGLVGRVISTTRSTATVLLITDRESVVGARLGSNAEIGFLGGRGELGGAGRLDLDLVDDSQTPAAGDVVVTWGSRHQRPYVAGVPIGTVESVVASPREQAKHAVIVPFVDFSSLDLVGVVVEDGARGAAGRGTIRAGRLPSDAPATIRQRSR